MSDIKISSVSPALNHPDFSLQESVDSPIKAPVKLENESADDVDEAVLLQASLEEVSPSSEENDEEMAKLSVNPLSSLTLDELVGCSSLEELTIPEEDKLPLAHRLIAQVQKILPLLVQLEQAQKRTQGEDMDLMAEFANKEVDNIYFQGVINFGGNALAAIITAAAGKEVGQLFSSFTSGVASLAEGAKTKAQKGGQETSIYIQEIQKTRQLGQQLYDRFYDATLRADQLGHTRA